MNYSFLRRLYNIVALHINEGSIWMRGVYHRLLPVTIFKYYSEITISESIIGRSKQFLGRQKKHQIKDR